jgi:hypothetical protein
MRGDLGGVAKGLMGLGKKVISGNKADKISKATRTSPADAIQWSGCKDSQTSADAVEAGSATGYVFLRAHMSCESLADLISSCITYDSIFLVELCPMLSSLP